MTETRTYSFRQQEGDGNTLTGYAAVFDSPTRIFERGREFDERIERGAFAKTLNSKERVVLQFDHGAHPFFGSLPLGRFTDMAEDAKGLYVEARLTDNWFVQPVRDAIADGGIDGMSFRFSVEDDEWEDRDDDVPLRTIKEVRLYEAGPVTWPAYEDTVVGVRSALRQLTDDEMSQLLSGLRSTPTPDEGQAAVTPDEGQQKNPTATKNQRQGRAVLAGIKGD